LKMRRVISGRRVILLSLFILVLILIFKAPTASAHALLVKSDPSQSSSIAQSPPRVTVWLTEPLESSSSTLKVLDANNSRVDNGDVTFSSDRLSMSVGIPTLAKGVYTVIWHAISVVDGHSTGGSFSFGVQTTPPPTSQSVSAEPSIISLIPEALARWTNFLGEILLVGGLFFHRLVLTPWLAKTKDEETNVKTLTLSCSRRILTVSLFATLITLAGSGGLLLIEYTVSPSQLADFLL